MAMVMMAMARVGCTNNMVNKNGNGHERYGKGGMHKQACTQEVHNLVPRAAQSSLFLLLNLLFDGCTNKLQAIGKEGARKQAEH